MEQAVLTDAIWDGVDSVAKVHSSLSADDFYESRHALIWKAISALYEDAAPINIVTVCDKLQFLNMNIKAEDVIDATGIIWDHSLFLSHNIIGIEYCARRLKELSVLRRSAIESQGSSSYILQSHPEASEAIELTIEHQTALRSELSSMDRPGKAESIAIAIAEAERRRNEPDSAVRSGIDAIDDVTGAFNSGDFILIAGRASMGKTDLAVNIGYNCAKAGSNVLMLSSEMNVTNVLWRVFSLHTAIFRHKFKTGKIEDEDLILLNNNRKAIEALPITILHANDVSVSKLRSFVIEENAKLAGKLNLVIVDYLGIMRPKKSNTREQEVAGISAGLKSIATELGIPLIAVSQMSRAAESRDDNIPQLSDLRESGALEQDSDIVIMLYRESYYESRKTKRDKGQVSTTDPRNDHIDAYVLKNRQGSTGIAKGIHYDRATGKIGGKGSMEREPVNPFPQIKEDYQDEALPF